jgi:hypothetical protein
LYFDKPVLDRIEKYHVLSKSDSLIGLWRFRRMLRKEGSLDFTEILNKFVKDFCGPKWSATVKTVDFKSYIDELGEDSGNAESGQQSDKLSD